ncbi:heat shock 22 kDa protein, mitochondrial-like [Mangifera indica]|uniref:heat shock 22 kDa protein, mitochondrial-like n=1 Tax=Mangifera indica TaxID=29780 RepID=UPI001CFA2D91|nr:heat shock 22 kDa protein, mitochondrial-like [Mangifera indica]
MAFSLVLKRLASSNLLPGSLSRTITPTAASASRFFNTNTVRQYDNESDDRDLDVDHRSARRRRHFFSDVFGRLSPTRSVSQMLNLMDQMTENPFFAGTLDGIRRGWDAKEDENALILRIDMPGLGKEDVKVSVEQNTLVIKEERAKEADDEESVRRYTSRIVLPEICKTSEIKAEMKNGVLKVAVPKVKEEGRSDVFHVNVE